jgi:putative transposase
MARKRRFAPPGFFNHITQRGNYRQRTFFSRHDHLTFLDLLDHHAAARQVDVLAYCLMPNHFHLIARGHQPNSISLFMQGLNGQYAQYLHARLNRRGRLWQERFYSSALSNSHLFAALRYVELNPVRAGLTKDATTHIWSSAAAHTGKRPAPTWLDSATFDALFSAHEWSQHLADGQPRSERALMRAATQWEVPLQDKEQTQTANAA